MKGSYWWYAAIVAGGVLMAMSCFDKGVTDLDDTRITQPVCSDLPQNDPRVIAGDCRTTREVLDVDERINHPWLFAIGLLVALGGLAGVTGFLKKLGDNDPKPPATLGKPPR